MSKSGGGVGIGTIIFMVIIGYNFLFDDDDEKEIDVVDQVEDVGAEAKDKVEPKSKALITSAKEKLREARDSPQFKKFLEKVNNTLDGTDEDYEIKEEVAEEEVKEEIAKVKEEEKSDAPPPQIISPDPEEQQPKTDSFDKL